MWLYLGAVIFLVWFFVAAQLENKTPDLNAHMELGQVTFQPCAVIIIPEEWFHVPAVMRKPTKTINQPHQPFICYY